ncbi:MAG: hypothetical protein KGK07_02205 [Chloroflexota bacterium]|nr:hypothetical protein [Chloroflexota bacterium]
MRLLTTVLAATVIALASGLAVAAAATPVPAHDGSRVGVQLGVLGAAAFTVLVVGSVAYLVRRRLGLAAPPSEQPPEGHH